MDALDNLEVTQILIWVKFLQDTKETYTMVGSLIPKTTQSDIPMKMNGGGLLSQRAIDFGLGNALTFLRDGQATFKNIGRTWNGDHHVDSADPVIAGKNFGN